MRSRLQWTGHTEKGWRMTDYLRERQSYESREGGDEGGQCWDGRTVLREMWRSAGEEGDWKKKTRQRRVEKTSRWGGEEVAGSTSSLIKGKRGREICLSLHLSLKLCGTEHHMHIAAILKGNKREILLSILYDCRNYRNSLEGIGPYL